MMKWSGLLGACLATATLAAQETRQPPPQIPFRVVEDFFQVPDTIWLAEAVGVALNAKGHIFILNRGNHPLLEFTADGKFVRSLGEGSPIFHAAHSVRFDAQDNMWVVDSGNDIIVKVTPKGRIEQALGRRREPWVWDTHGIERAIPAPPSFYQPTDTVVGPDGSTYVTDGYGNSRVAKYDKNGKWIKNWGSRGTGPGQFNIVHGIAIDALGNVYVADEGNKRVQVFDSEGIFKTQFTNVGTPTAICITRGPQQVLYVAHTGDPDGMEDAAIYKLNLQGTILGKFGSAGKLPKEFGLVNSIDCRNENELLVGELSNWRVQKLTLRASR